jgi:hypothetical protein
MDLPDEKTCQENQRWLDSYRAVIEKWLEFAIDELDKDRARVPTVDILEQLYYRAKWEKYVDVMMSTNTVLTGAKEARYRWQSNSMAMNFTRRPRPRPLGIDGARDRLSALAISSFALQDMRFSKTSKNACARSALCLANPTT